MQFCCFVGNSFLMLQFVSDAAVSSCRLKQAVVAAAALMAAAEQQQLHQQLQEQLRQQRAQVNDVRMISLWKKPWKMFLLLVPASGQASATVVPP